MTSPKLESHWRLLSPSNFLGAPDLRGRDVRVRIASVSREDLNVEGQDDKAAKVVITFEGKSKGWVPCKTALRQIHVYLGTGLTADWIGKEIWLHPTSREWRQKTRDWTGKPIRNPQLNMVDEAIRVWPVEPPASIARGSQQAPARRTGAGPSSPPPSSRPAPAAEPDPIDLAIMQAHHDLDQGEDPAAVRARVERLPPCPEKDELLARCDQFTPAAQEGDPFV
jgi:hypothetical protein